MHKVKNIDKNGLIWYNKYNKCWQYNKYKKGGDNMTPEARAKKNEYKRKWNKEHREQYNAYQRKWRREHPDKVAKYNETYWEKKARQTV